MSEVKYPFDIEGGYICVFYQDGDTPIILGRWGFLESDVIEKDFFEDLDVEELFSKGEGEYYYKVSHEPEQRGEYGRVEIEGYFDFQLVKFIGHTG